MGSLLVKVQAKIVIHAHEKVRGVLEGEYGSVFKGRSMDFDDLREYTPGDDIKDIDWKATARSGSTKIRRYVAVRKHNILLVVDTGRNMIASSEKGETKKDIAVLVAGVVGYLSQKHGDLVGLVSGDNRSSKYLPLKPSRPHLERILQEINSTPSSTSGESDLSVQLEYVAKAIRRKMLIVVVHDDGALTDQYVSILRRLRAQHEILWISIGDSTGMILDKVCEDIDQIAYFPDYIKQKHVVAKSIEHYTDELQVAKAKQLDRLGITNCRITSEADTVMDIYKLLERHKNARTR